MLSRLANAVYWVARYNERAENTARIMMMHTNLMLDTPPDVIFGWEPVLAINGSTDLFDQYHSTVNEKEVIDFLIADPNNVSSIRMSLAMARENLRTARAQFPRDAWETMNDLYWYSQQETSQGLNQRNRYKFLRHVIDACQQFNGILSGTMCDGMAYDFIRLGRYLERADMTTRVIDVRASNLLLGQLQELKPFADIQWMSILKSLAAYQMYRQHVNTRVTGTAVLTFLLQDQMLPRSVYRCLAEMHTCLNNFVHHEMPQEKINSTLKLVKKVDIKSLEKEGLNEFMDQIQVELAELHQLITQTYFSLEPETLPISIPDKFQSQSQQQSIR